jgi:hypothetical protein
MRAFSVATGAGEQKPTNDTGPTKSATIAPSVKLQQIQTERRDSVPTWNSPGLGRLGSEGAKLPHPR